MCVCVFHLPPMSSLVIASFLPPKRCPKFLARHTRGTSKELNPQAPLFQSPHSGTLEIKSLSPVLVVKTKRSSFGYLGLNHNGIGDIFQELETGKKGSIGGGRCSDVGLGSPLL